MDDAIPLAQLPRTLMERAGGATPPSYRTVHQYVLDGKMPATRVKGRWVIDPADLPRIAKMFGLRMPTDRSRNLAA